MIGKYWKYFWFMRNRFPYFDLFYYTFFIVRKQGFCLSLNFLKNYAEIYLHWTLVRFRFNTNKHYFLMYMLTFTLQIRHLRLEILLAFSLSFGVSEAHFLIKFFLIKKCGFYQLAFFVLNFISFTFLFTVLYNTVFKHWLIALI